MSHIKRPEWATLLLLGLLFLRALVPAGFMLAPVDDRFAVVLCDGHMSAGGHQHHHDHSDHQDPICPYAQSSGPAPLPTLPMLAAGAAPASQRVARAGVTQTLLRFGPIRQQAPRGPPTLA